MTELENRRLFNLERTGRNISLKWSNRIEEIQEMVDKGGTLESIGIHFGVSKERIRQIFKKYRIITSKSAKQYFRDKIAARLRLIRQIEKTKKILLDLEKELQQLV